MSDVKIKTGDTVKHGPTGELWTVAYVDYDSGHLAWVGWPEGLARLSNCELKESCSEEESLDLLFALASSRDEGGRADARKLRAYRELFPQHLHLERIDQRMRAVKGFINWLQDHEYTISHRGWKRAEPDDLLDEFLAIDRTALERERQFMLARQKKANEKHDEKESVK